MLLSVELPPRARRIFDIFPYSHIFIGTTSACAENTIFERHLIGQDGNYLRVRGEYPVACVNVVTTMELPPRARRIPRRKCSTSIFLVNYLRVRGEYNICSYQPGKMRELPPRARRIRGH